MSRMQIHERENPQRRFEHSDGFKKSVELSVKGPGVSRRATIVREREQSELSVALQSSAREVFKAPPSQF